MKFIAPVLLVTYSIYSAFVQINIAHSFILFSLAALFALQSFISHRQENTKLLATLEHLKKELGQEWAKHKEANDKKIAQLEDDVLKLSMNTSLRSSSSPSKAAESRKVVF